MANPPKVGDRVNIFIQMTETNRVHRLAEMIAKRTKGQIHYISEPRKKADENDLHVDNAGC